MSFGWSVGDIVATVQTLTKLGKSLKESGGAAAEYQEVVTFLSSVSRTLGGIQSLIQDNPNFRWKAALVEQGDILRSAIDDFNKKIEKYDKSLGFNTQRHKARRIPREVQFALFLSDEVKVLRAAITQPQLVLDVFINLQILTSVLDISRTSSLSGEKLESLTQIASQLIPAITIHENSLEDFIRSENREVRSLQEMSETQIREDLASLKMHLGEVKTLQRVITECNQADNQALLRPQVELQHSIEALHRYLKTQLDLLIEKKVEKQTFQQPNLTNIAFQPFGMAQVIGSGIASWIGTMFALSSHIPTDKSNEIRNPIFPHRPAGSTVPLVYDKAWENAYKAFEDEDVRDENKHSEVAHHIQTQTISSPDDASSSPPDLIGFVQCCVCCREINTSLHGSTNCPDCDHERCTECTTLKRKAMVRDWVPAYDLLKNTVHTFLREIFGEYDFKIFIKSGRFCFTIPRSLSSVGLQSAAYFGGYEDSLNREANEHKEEKQRLLERRGKIPN